MKSYLITMFLLASVYFSMSAQEKIRAETLDGLPIGTVVEDFSTVDQNGNDFNLALALEKGPLVLVFYRGFWCPYCNKHLEILQDSLSMIEELGAGVVAISPEKPEFLEKMVEKSGAAFTLLYDEDYLIEDAFGLTFNPSKMQLTSYNVFLGAKLKESHSDDSQRLPIPATYIIDQDRKIVWRQFDPDYKKRSSVRSILSVLENMEK